MYIRWKKQARASEHTANHPFGINHNPKVPDTLSIAYLVKSERVDGKPRQKTLYLASIRDSQMSNENHRRWFWNSVAAKIAPLNLPIEQQRALKSKLNERIPDA